MTVADVAVASVCDDGTIGALIRMNQESPSVAAAVASRPCENGCRCVDSPRERAHTACERRDMGRALEAETGDRQWDRTVYCIR